MRSKRKQIESRLGASAFFRIRNWLSRKTLAQSERIGERLGRMAFRLGKSRRRRTLSNLELAFPEKTLEERQKIAQGVFVHFGRAMCDFVRSDTRPGQEVLDSIEIDGFPDIYAMLPKDEGSIILTGHFGYWERIAHYLALKGYPLAVVVRDANDGGLNDAVLGLRKAAGLEVIPRGSAARAVLAKLKKQEQVAMLPDQNADDAFIPFFGKPAGTVLGPAVLAQRAKVSLYITFCYRVGPGKYRFRLADKIGLSETLELSAEHVMARFNLALEKMVREFPEQYLWMHDRWKTARRKGML